MLCWHGYVETVFFNIPFLLCIWLQPEAHCWAEAMVTHFHWIHDLTHLVVWDSSQDDTSFNTWPISKSSNPGSVRIQSGKCANLSCRSP